MIQSTKVKQFKIIAVIQARMGSKRLKNKALLKILNKTLIETIRDRLKYCQEIDKVVLATSATSENDLLAQHAKDISLPYYRGSENDLISRHLETLQKFGADALVRITADCPLVDPKLIDEMVKTYRKKPQSYDLMTNTQTRTFPDGLDLDVIPRQTLEKLDQEVKNLEWREGFIGYMLNNEHLFKIHNFAYLLNLFSWRLTLDYPEDLILIEKIFNRLSHQPIFYLEDIIKLLKANPQLLEINKKWAVGEDYYLKTI